MHDTCVLYLLRHGATESNVAQPPRLQGRGVNLGLSTAGRRQAELAAAWLQNQPIAAVYASPLVRAQETAAVIAAPHGLTPHTIPAITEADVGRWEGRSWVEIAQTEPDAHRLFLEDCGTHGYAGGETFTQVQQRVTPALEQLCRENLGRTIVVVGHNVVNRAYLAHVLALPIARSRTLIQDNCGLNVLHHRAGETRLITMNAVFHLSQ